MPPVKSERLIKPPSILKTKEPSFLDLEQKIIHLINTQFTKINERLDRLEKVNKQKETERELKYFIDNKFMRKSAELDIEMHKMQE